MVGDDFINMWCSALAFCHRRFEDKRHLYKKEHASGGLGATDTSVLIAVIIYATIPATRYTVEGLRSVPSALHDAGSMSGVTRIQRLLKIEFPLAFPHIMLGLNQTVVFALFMVIIGAFIGTEDLGQYIMKALSDLKGGGKGLILGLCVAFIGLAVDNLIRTWAERRKQLLGLS